MVRSYECARTEITNVSGHTLSRVSIFGGIQLRKGQTHTVKGDVWAWLAGKFPGIKGLRMIEKLHDLIDNGVLAITAVPATCGDVWNSSSSQFVTA